MSRKIVYLTVGSNKGSPCVVGSHTVYHDDNETKANHAPNGFVNTKVGYLLPGKDLDLSDYINSSLVSFKQESGTNFNVKDYKINVLHYEDFIDIDTTIKNDNMALLKAITEDLVFPLETYESIIYYLDSEKLVNGIKNWLPVWAKNGWKRDDGGSIQYHQIWRDFYTTLEKIKQNTIIEFYTPKPNNPGLLLSKMLVKSLLMNKNENWEDRVSRKHKTVSGYWKSSIERNPLLNQRYLFYPIIKGIGNFICMIDGIKEPYHIARRVPSSSYSVIFPKEKKDFIYDVIKKQKEEVIGFDKFCYLDLDLLYSPNLLRTYEHFGLDTFYSDELEISVLKSVVSEDLISSEITPVALSTFAEDMFEKLISIYEEYKNNKESDWLTYMDITNMFFEQKNKKTELRKELKPGVTGFEIILEHPRIKKYKGEFGKDLPSRNRLKNFESYNPKVSLIIENRNQNQATNFFFVIESDLGDQLYSAYYTNKLY